MPNNIRYVEISVPEKERHCDQCSKSLELINDTIFIAVPTAKVVHEYCSWFCLFTHIKTMLSNKLLSKKLCGCNLLAKLSYDGIEKNIKARLKPKE